MRRRPAIIDTNVVVAGLLTADATAPTARIVDGMLRGVFPFALSVALLAEYRRVLSRERIRDRHGLTEDQIDGVLASIAANAIVREVGLSTLAAPDSGDQLLWDLLAGVPDAVLVTGDKRLIDEPPRGRSVLFPASFLDGVSPNEPLPTS